MRSSKANIVSNLFRIANKAKAKANKFKSPKILSRSEEYRQKVKDEIALAALKLDADTEDVPVPGEVSTILHDDICVKQPDPIEIEDVENLERALHIPWLSSTIDGHIPLGRKEVSRERKQKWIFKSSQGNRFSRLVKMCANRLGTETTLQVFGRLGRETGVKEYNALIGICVSKARATDDEEVSIEQVSQAFHLFKSMREQGFELAEESYSPVLMYLIDMGMVEEFHFFYEVIKDQNPSSISRLGYYEMMLWLAVHDEEKIKELCEYIAVNEGEGTSDLQENYLLALCESDRKEELLQLLEIIDITKLSSGKYIANIFQALGRLMLETLAKKFLLAFKTCDDEADNISNLIAIYAVSIPNLVVEDVISKFRDLHQKLDVSPSSSSFEKLILHSCDLHKVHDALDIVDEMCKEGFPLSTEVLHTILRVCEETCDYNLVHRIYSIICHYNLNSNGETFGWMINLYVKMKDFEGAYKMLDNLEERQLAPTSGMYNYIMAGFFREKNIPGGLRVLKQMERAGVKPDSQTFSYLISNSETEENIVKYYKELKQSGVHATKQIYIALINAYASCEQLEKAKQVVLDPGIPVKNLIEIKSALVSALASHGQLSEAFHIYEEIKQAGHNLEPKAVTTLIEYTQSDGELDRLLQLLKELTDPDYWFDGCVRVILYCIRNKNLSSAVDLFKQLRDKFQNDELFMEAIFDEVFALIATSESAYLQIGLDLLWVIKDELGLSPSRKCLDFLLSACANARDLHNARLVWKEYKAAGLPYNVLSCLRMYRALLASGEPKSANAMLQRIPKEDSHVRQVIDALQHAYADHVPKKPKKKKGLKKKKT
ncbi:hypothetical protein L6164_018571 [Bauhinia variegata]|uniref:Uncharacterized protein n=1 Tax=Bauhinia variegata TaxID=167791 RepID=A0ACB9NC91_BAUVA|nr:hypothetical protein L6164_018571 [Bauhinia variegata]